MDKEEVIQKIKDIGTCEDEADRRSMLVSLQEEVTNIFDTNERLTTDNANLNQTVTKLREDNMNLFLAVGTKDEPDDPSGDPEPEKLKFEDLFNDKGGLK